MRQNRPKNNTAHCSVQFGSNAGFSRPAVFLSGAAVIIIAMALNWLINVPQEGFFVDVPAQMACIQDNTMHIQFPGYVPYHLLIALLSRWVGDPWRVSSLLSLTAAIVAVIYIMRSCHFLAGRAAATCGGAVAASCTLTIYIAASGATYMLDAMCASAVLFYGLRNLGTERANSFQNAAAWFFIGVLIRPLSMVWMFPGLLMLVQRKRPGAQLSLLAGGAFCTVLAFLLFSLPFYDSLTAFLASAHQLGDEVQDTAWQQFATNLFRWMGYPLYLFHIWIAYIGWQCIRTRREPVRPELIFVLATTALYDLLLLRYIPHAGYLCLLMPALVILPMVFEQRPAAPPRALVVACVIISLCQFYAARPLPPNGLKTAVANAYFLQYSKAGIATGRFETLSSELVRTNVETHRIPPKRRTALEKQLGNTP